MDGPDSIAIIGIGCKFPGADNLEEFWRVLVNGEDHVQAIPMERFNIDAFYDSHADAPGKLYMKNAGLVKGFKEWDNQLYGIGDNEAKQIDPQQRFVLDCVHMAMEDGGITKKAVNGTETGVYIGMMNDDYKLALLGEDNLITNYTVTGSNSSIISARVSYLYNLLGPSVVLDTACSSALVAVHMAASAIKTGDISMAVCGGVSCIFNPEVFISLSKARMASPTGKCQAFSKHADGYARGEGCGIVILKRFDKALEDNNKIWGLIATGCNQDGSTTSPITAPSQSQQIKLLEKVFRENQVPPSSIQYIEAHGTGTPVGDPIEANALGTFFKEHSEDNTNGIFIGSVKTNIGHLESAAGVAGLIKILLMMRNGKIVRSLHSDQLNPKIDFAKYRLIVPQHILEWPGSVPRLACINSFGFGGTNSHAIIKQYVKSGSEQIVKDKTQTTIVVLSANDNEALASTANNFVTALKTTKYSIDDIAYTTTVRRDHHRFRTFFVCDSLKSLISSVEMKSVHLGNIKPIPLREATVVFVFCGVGTAWDGMCSELIRLSPAFDNMVRRIDKLLRPLTQWSIYEILKTKQGVTHDPLKNHIGIFTCQVALVELWRTIGVIPKAVIGQSVGEVAAAYASGSLDLQQAINVIYHRSNVLADATGGSMAVIRGEDIDIVKEKCKRLQSGRVSIAVYLSNDCCTVSGDPDAMEELKSSIESKGHTKFVTLNVKCAYHSHFTKEPGHRLVGKLCHLTPIRPFIKVFSSVTGKQADPTTYASPAYWSSNVSDPVLFHQAVCESRSAEEQVFYLEIGPSPVLRAHLQSIFSENSTTSLPSMTKGNEVQTLFETVGNLYSLGNDLKWENLIKKGNLTDIPTYSFNKKVLFEESSARCMKRSLNRDKIVSTMLLDETPQSNSTDFSITLNRRRTEFIYEHLVDGSVIIPGALYGEIGLEVGEKWLGVGVPYAVSWKIHNPRVISAEQSVTLQVKCLRTEETISFSVSEKGNQLLSSGLISQQLATNAVLAIDKDISALKIKPKDDVIYKILRKFGFSHGPIYQIVRRGIYTKDQCFAEILLSDHHLKMQQSTILHPVIVDGILQCCCSFLPFHEISSTAKIFPVGIGHLSVSQKVTKRMFIYAKLVGKEDSKFSCNAVLLQENGIIAAEMQNIETKILSSEADVRGLSYSYQWEIMESYVPKSLQNPKSFLLLSWSKSLCDLFRGDINFRPIHLDNRDELELSVAAVEQYIAPGISIVYSPGYVMCDDESTENTYSKILQSGKMLLHLIKLTSKVNSRIVVVTEATQNMNKDNQRVNPVGSELWGFVRSAAMEPTKTSFYLIDTFPTVKVSLRILKEALDIIRNKDGEFPSETRIADGAIFYGFISNAQNLARRGSLVSSGDIRFERCQDDSLDCQEPHETKQKRNKSTVTVKVFAACRCILSAEEVTTRSSLVNVSEMWKSPETVSEENLYRDVVELVGRSVTQKGEIICCYPCVFREKVDIPKRFVCRMNEVKDYRPGMFQSCILAMYISEAVTGHRLVGILADEKFLGVVRLLEIMFDERKTVLNLIRDWRHLNRLEQSTSCLVFLTTTINNDIRFNPDILHHVSKILCTENALTFISATKPKCAIELLEKSDALGVQSITKRFKKAKAFLKRYSKSKYLQNTVFGNSVQTHQNNSIQRNKCAMQEELNEACEKCSYVVVGGLTGLGWLIVKFLANKGASKIFILSRRLPDGNTKLKLQNIMHMYSVSIVPVQADICDLCGLKKTFTKLLSLCKDEPIRGIFHGAAVTADSFATTMTMEQFETAMKPKVLGTLNLDLISRELDLHYFTMHSSVAALLGNPGQCNYSSGNSFEDGMALYRRSLGLRAQSIVWGALDVGLASDTFTQDALKSKGFLPLTQNQIVQCFDNSLRSDEVSPCYTNIDWSSFLQTDIESQRLKFKNFIVYSSKQEPYDVDMAESIDMSDNIQKTVVHCLASVFALHPSQISSKCPVIDFGLDSQKGTELASLLFEKLHVRVPYIYLATDDHSASDIAQYIRNRKMNQDHSADKTHNGETMKEETGQKWETFIHEKLLTSPHLEYKQIHMHLRGSEWRIEDLNMKLQSLSLLHDSLRTEFTVQKNAEGNQHLVSHVVDPLDSVLSIEILKQMAVPENLSTRKAEDASFRIIILQYRPNSTMVLLFCPLLFDSSSISLVCEHVIRMLEASSKESYSKGIRHVSVDYHNLGKLDEKLAERHWKTVLNGQKCLPLRTTERVISVKDHFSHEIPDIIVCAAAKKAQSLGLSLYQSTCCLIQFALHTLTSASQVTILAQTDVRPQLGVSESTQGRLTNIIPLLADFSNMNGDTFSEYITRSVASFSSLTNEILLPFYDIRQLPEFNPYRHEFLLCSFLDISNVLNGREEVLQIEPCSSGFSSISNIELLIVYTHTSMRLYLSGRPQSNVAFSGDVLLETIGNVMRTFIGDELESFKPMIHSVGSVSSNTTAVAGRLYSKRKLGAENTVEPKFTKPEGQGRCLILGRTKLPVHDIVDVTTKIHKGRNCVEIRARRKTHVVYANDLQTCEMWASYIIDSLNPLNRKGKQFGSMSSLCSKIDLDETEETESTQL